jgi:hypothetical protein
MENLDNDMPREGAFFGTGEIKGYLLETAKWGFFLAIVGYVGVGIMVLACIFIMTAGSMAGNFPGSPIPMGAMGLMYLVIAAFYFFPVYYLHQFSIKIKEGLRSQSVESTTDGFRNLKSLYKFMAIFMIVILSIYALIFVGVLVAGLAM